jgi:hypothetical protein
MQLENNVQIPVKDYIALYNTKERDKKLTSIGI